MEVEAKSESYEKSRRICPREWRKDALAAAFGFLATLAPQSENKTSQLENK